MRALFLTALLLPSMASAQVVGTLEDHARHVLYGNPGTGYGLDVALFQPEDGAEKSLLVGAEYEQLQDFIQAGAVYNYGIPGAEDPAALLGTYFEGGDVALRRLGREIATGDFDGNGLTDVVYAANDRRGLFNNDYGTIFIRWGDTPTAGVWQLVASQSDSFGGFFGARLSVADLNLDGIDDLVAGDPRGFPALLTENSRAAIFYGDEHLGPWAGEDPLVTWNAVSLEEDGGIAGDVVSADADWNCDGIPDLLIGGLLGRAFLLLNPGDGWTEHTTVRSASHFWVEFGGELASSTLNVTQMDDLTGDGCADVLLGIPASLDFRGEVALVDGRTTAEWGPSESTKALEDVAWIRRRGALPGGLAGYAVQPVHWVTPPTTPAKPDLLISAPTAAAASLDFEPTGRVMFVPGSAMFGESGEPVAKDPPGTLPSDHPRLEDLAVFLYEGRTVDLALGTTLTLWDNIDDDDQPDVVVSAPGYKLDPAQTTPAEGALFLLESSLFGDADLDEVLAFEDCDDGDATVYPGAEEFCDGEDTDCNGVADFGEPGVDTEADVDNDGSALCDGDCDDEVSTTYPDAEELCNGVDDDCDNRADEPWDADGDGYPAPGEPCEDLAAAGGADCNDTDPAIHPAAGDGPGLADTDCDGDTGWIGGCACSSAERTEVAAVAWVLLAVCSLALRRRRNA